MKKFLAITFVIVLSIFTASCGSEPSPSDVVNDYLKAVKAQDAETMSKIYEGDVSDVSITSDEGIDTDSFPEELEKKLNDMFLSYEYSVANEQINGNTATVDVTIKTYAFGSVFREAFSEAFSKILDMAFSGASDDEMDKVTNDIIAEKLEGAVFNYEETATVSLTKGNDGWIIDEFEEDGDFVNCITGGMIEFAKDMSDSFSDTNAE